MTTNSRMPISVYSQIVSMPFKAPLSRPLRAAFEALSQMLLKRSPPGKDRVKGGGLRFGGCTALAEAKMYTGQFGTHSQGHPERNVVVAGPVRPPIMV